MNAKNILILSYWVLSLSFNSCLKDESVKLAYNGFQPLEMNDGWQISTAGGENMDENFLNDAFHLVHNNERFVMARSLLIIRNGKIVAESYPHDPEDAHRTENIQSCTKSFTSVLTGIALTKKYLDSISQTFYSICPDYFINHPDKKNITIANALTMKTGINFIDSENTRPLYETEGSSVDYILSLPKNYEPGIVFQYNDGTPHLISAAIQQRYGKPLSVFADEFLFKPLGITNWKWEAANDGISFGAVSIFMKPRDLAKFGQMMLQNGKWGDQQIVDSSWIAVATRPQVTMHSPGTSYGYYFWVYPPYSGYAAVGHGGQFILVVPPKNLVVIYTAWPYTSGDMFDNFNELADLILKSCN
jgi:CubicO group peptidase (beta-lactamase class C family)